MSKHTAHGGQSRIFIENHCIFLNAPKLSLSLIWLVIGCWLAKIFLFSILLIITLAKGSDKYDRAMPWKSMFYWGICDNSCFCWFHHNFPIFRLLKYLDGTRHVEDIMYCENLARSELCTIIDKFHPMLYEIQAPDPATSYYAKVS